MWPLSDMMLANNNSMASLIYFWSVRARLGEGKNEEMIMHINGSGSNWHLRTPNSGVGCVQRWDGQI